MRVRFVSEVVRQDGTTSSDTYVTWTVDRLRFLYLRVRTWMPTCPVELDSIQEVLVSPRMMV